LQLLLHLQLRGGACVQHSLQAVHPHRQLLQGVQPTPLLLLLLL
jgi:hypothetical protein